MNRLTPVVPILLAACLTTLAQPSGALLPESSDGKLWLTHTVTAKENWYSVGRLYHLSPRDIAAYNATDMAKPLDLGKKLRIPLTDANFTQTGKPSVDEAFVPLYHVVAEKEGLYRIGQEYNRVGTEKLKVMNGLNSDAIRSGSRLIVGYLKVAKSQKEWNGRTIKPSEAPAIIATNPSDKAPIPTVEKPVANEGSKAIAPQPQAKRDTPAIPSVVKREESAPIENRLDTGLASGGYFASLYAEQSRAGKRMEQKGTVASFKSTSGWKDGKFYMLMNNVPVGTVVRVSHLANGRVIHAKVLGELPPIRENEKIAARMSNASFSALNLPEGSHELQLEWMKQ